MEEHFKNVKALIGIIFYYSYYSHLCHILILHLKTMVKYVSTKKDTVLKENLFLAGKTPNIFSIKA